MPTYSIEQVLAGRIEVIRDPLTGNVLAFEETDLAAAVATLLADNGYVVTRVGAVPKGAPVQVIVSEEEAVAVAKLLLAELALVRNYAGSAAERN